MEIDFTKNPITTGFENEIEKKTMKKKSSRFREERNALQGT